MLISRMIGYLFIVLHLICLQEYYTEVPKIDWSALLCKHFDVWCVSDQLHLTQER